MASGLPASTVRPLMQNIAMLGPAACMAAIIWAQAHAAGGDGSGGATSAVLPLMAGADGLLAFSLAGLYCTHADLSPKYAGALLGLTNFAGALGGTSGVFVTGLLVDQLGDWNLAFLGPSVLCLTLGAAAYTFVCKKEPVDFDTEDDSPFGVEAALRAPLAWCRDTAKVRSPLSSCAACLEYRSGSQCCPAPPI